MPTRFILINVSHAGNVGAAARALKVMGFDELVLVAPRWANVLRREETIQRASGALDVLAKARIVETLDEALDGMAHLCATAMTPRDFGPPTYTPREYFELLQKKELLTHKQSASAEVLSAAPAALAGIAGIEQQGMAFLFGSERFGMQNTDVYRCHAALSIPTNPGFGSLNLASAVQVIAYDWRLALGGFSAWNAARADALAAPEGSSTATGVASATTSAATPDNWADAAQVAGMLAHLEQALVAVDFLNPAAPKKLMPRLNSMFNRMQVTQEEIHILRGIAKAVLHSAAAAKATPQTQSPSKG